MIKYNFEKRVNMWLFKKKTAIQKVFDKYKEDANKLLGYLAEQLKIITVDLTKEEQERETRKLAERILDDMGVDFLSKFRDFSAQNVSNAALLKEITSDDRFIEKKKNFEEYIKQKRIEEARDQKFADLRKLCVSVCEKLDIPYSKIIRYIDEAIEITKNGGEDIPNINLRNAYLLVFNAIVLELSENDYRLDGYILNVQGSMYEEKLKDIADCLYNEGYESIDIRNELLKNALERIHLSNQKRDEIEKLRAQGVPTFSFDSENEKRVYESRFGQQAIWEKDSRFDKIYDDATALMEKEQFVDAIDKFKECLSLNPVSKRALLGFGECCIACHRIPKAKKAIEDLDGLLETNEDIARYYKLYALYEKTNDRFLTAYACISYCKRFTKNGRLLADADILKMDILVANGTSFTQSPTEILKNAGIKIYSYISANYIVSQKDEFWLDIQNVFQGLNRVMLKEFAPTMIERNGGSFDSDACKVQINVHGDLTHTVMCMREMSAFTSSMFQITFEQLSPNSSEADRAKLKDILCEENNELLTQNDIMILSNRYEEYLSLLDESVIVGYSRGELISRNKDEIETTDFLRYKAAIFFSDLIWMQSEHNRYFSMKECLNNAKLKKVDVYEGLNNAKKTHGAFTFVDLVYNVLQETFRKYQ